MLRSVAVVVPVLLIFAVWYVTTDPFMALRHYDTYFLDYGRYPARVGVNKGIATFANLIDRRAAGDEYNAFILGSSISCYYDAGTWASLLADDGRTDSIHPYHLDSASETLASMARKVSYLDANDIPIDYALIVLDPIIMDNADGDSPAYLDPPVLHDGVLETVRYHYTFFRAATNADFFKSWIPARLTGQPVDNGRNRIFEVQPIAYDPLTNQESIPLWDSIISADPARFYADHPLAAPPVHLTVQAPVLTAGRVAALRSIAEVFRRRHTDCQIIVGPNRAGVTLNPRDLAVMQDIFGHGRVHDYSASQAHLLRCDTALYDNTHYRPYVATRLMRLTYPGRRQ